MKTTLYSALFSPFTSTNNRFLRPSFKTLLVSAFFFLSLAAYGQVWNYDFGTATGTAINSNSGSGNIAFFSSLPTGGGTYRVRIGTGGGNLVLANPGTTLGTLAEAQLNASTSTSTNKLAVYDWAAPSTVAYLKAKVRTTSSGNGNLNISLGLNTVGSDNQGYTSHYNNSVASLTIVYTEGTISSIVRRVSGSNTAISSSGLSKDTDQLIEIYANNNAAEANYIRGGTSYTLAARTWDLWVDGTRVVINGASAGTLSSGTNLSGIAFFAESSIGNAAYFYIDDIEYSNNLPAIAIPTVTTTPVSSITTTSATSGGNVTADGGAGVNAKGVYYGLEANPTSGTSDGTGIGSFTSPLTGLEVNTQYYYRAYATNSAGTAYGTESSLYTLANIPAAPIVAGPTATSLNISVNGNGNPAGTQYALRETTTNQFVQADGSLGAAAVWQTAAVWGTKTVNGLTPSTSYTFETAAKNGANVETVYSAATNGTTAVNQLLDYWNLQWPSAASIPEGSTFEGYAQAYKGGFTEAAGATSGLSAWIGYSMVNNDPRSPSWIWIPATFNVQVGNNDEFKATLGAGLTPGTYYYASRFQLNSGTYQYGGFQGNWNNNSGVLTVTSNVAGYANIQSPYSGTITQGGDFNVYAQVYKGGITDSGTVDSSKITSWIGISPTNAATESDFSTWTWIPSAYNTKIGNNFEYYANIAGASRPAGTYYYVSRFQVIGSTEYRYGGTNNNFWSGAGNSGVLTVQTPPKINVTQGSTNIPTAGTYAFGNQVYGTSSAAVTFTVENTGQANLTLGTLSLSGANALEFTVTQTASATVTGGSATTFTVTFSPASTGAKTATVTIPNNTGTPYTFNVNGTGALNTAPNNGLNLKACIGNSQTTLSWTAATGGATGYIVYAFEGTTVPAMASASAGNASSYTASSDFNAATTYGTLGKAVYKGNVTTATITGLTQGQQYTFKVVAYNGETATGWANGINDPGSWNATYTIKIPEVGNPGATVAPTTSVVSWNVVPASSGCYEYLVVASQGSVVFTPSGDGSAYSANTVFSGNNQVVYKAGGTGNTVTVTGLTEGQQYCYRIFVREVNSSQWSAGTEICTTAGLNYCASASTNSTDNGITAVEFNTISNISAATESYTDFTGVSTAVMIGETYELSVRVKTYFSNTNYVKAWIDWNRNGSFESGEDYDLGTAVNTADGYTANSPLMIRVPSNAATGNTRLRIISREDSAPTACTAYTYGETEDYTLVVTKPADAEINIKGGNITIPSGSSTVSSLSNTLFALTDVGASTESKTFTIENIGQATLNLTAAPAVQLLGDHPADFTVTQQPSVNAVGVNGSVTFSIKFNPTTSDVRTATVSISNNDPTGAENPYTFRIQGTGKCTTVPVLSMLPASGPAGTVVTLASSVNDLTGAVVRLNGTVLTPLSTGTTEIKVKIPAGANDGDITVRLQTGCVFTQVFDVVSNEISGCEGSESATVPSDLFISEVTDSNTGGLTYVEIYNGTGGTKNLSGYKLTLYNNGSTTQNGGTVSFNNYNLMSGATYVIAVGHNTSGTQGSNYCLGDGSLANQVSGIGGINFSDKLNDHIRLYNGENYVDAFGVYENNNWSGTVIGTKGGTFKRRATAGLPSTVFDLADWTVLDFADDGGCTANDYSDVGKYTLSIPEPPVITAQPVFTPTCQSIQLTVSAAEGVSGGNGLAYQWFALAPGAATWNPVADGGVYSGATTATLNISSATGLGHFQYYAQVRENSVTCYTASGAVQIQDTETKWTATGWTNGAPTLTSKVVLERNYDTAVEGDLSACSLEIKNGYELKVRSGTLVTVAYQITNHATPENVVVENDANLIQVQDAAPSNTGTVTVQRNSRMKRLDYTYWSAPVAGQNLKAFSPGTLSNRFYTYNEWDDKFTGLDPLNNNFAPAKGYVIRASNLYPAATAAMPAPVQNFAGVFKGVPNNGPQPFPLVKSTTGNGYNLVGNPYPSNLDFYKLADSNAGIMNKVAYFWTNMNPNPAMQGSNYPEPVDGVVYYNNYAVLNATGGIPATMNSVDPGDVAAIKSATPTRHIKVGQGFIVQAKTDGVLTFSNAYRSSDAGSVFFNSKGAVQQEEKSNRFWLHLETPLRVVTTQLIGYVNQATDGLDPDYDSKLMLLGSDAFYSVLEDTKLGIQGRAPFVVSDRVPLGSSHDTAGNFTIYLGQPEGIFAGGQPVYLKDKHTGILTNLSQGSYTFTADKGLSEGRFEIVYQPETALGTGNPDKDDLSVYRDGTDFVVRSAVKKIAALEVYDMSGKLVLSQLPNQTEFRIDASALVNGVYLLKINRNGEWVNRKISR